MSKDDEKSKRPEAETLPAESPTAGEAARERGGVEWEGEKGGKGGHETHGAGEHDDPNN
jgi:hypothetical protein